MTVAPLVIRRSALFAFILCNFHVYMWDYAYIKDLCLTIFNDFLCIYLGEGSGSCINTCICMGTHSQHFRQKRLMNIYETW